MTPTWIWISAVGAVSCGLAYYVWILLPASQDDRLEGAVRAFGRAVELRFPNHAGLTETVAKLCRRVGVRMGFGSQRLRHLERVARLRDIGLSAIPYRLVNRRQWSDWTLSETATYDCHPEVGGAILETIPSLSAYAEGVRAHHAPFASPENESDFRAPVLEARIVKVCAEYVWYSRHLGAPAALKHIHEGMGTLYDPQVAHELLKVVRSNSQGELAVTSSLV